MKLDKSLNFINFIEKIESNALLVRKQKWKIICLLTDINNFSEFVKLLNEFKFEIEFYGTVVEISRKFEKDELSFKGYISQYNNLIYFFSNENKEDIEKYFVKKFLSKVKHAYYLWIPKIIIEDIINEFENKYEKLFITEFHAERELVDKLDSHFRKNFNRKITYSGKDGLEALKELRYYYGIRPYLVEFNIVNNCSFRINTDGFFIYNGGNLLFLIKTIERIYEKVKDIINLTKSSVFEEVYINTLKIYTINAQPIIVKFPNYQLTTDNINLFLGDLKKFGFDAFNESIEEGSIIFNADIIDTNKKAIFKLSSGGRELVLTPQFDTTFDTLFRFIEVLSEKMDSELEYEPYRHPVIKT